jgi:DNA-binding NarL/FixJ family response regulator
MARRVSAGTSRLALVAPHGLADRPRPARATRVLIADGQALVRAGLRALLEAAGPIIVTGEAATGEDALALARTGSPDVLLIDAMLPGLDCVETARRIVRETSVAVMLLTPRDDDERVFAALRAGIRGLVPKDAAADELLRGVEALARGDVQLSSGHARRLVAELTAQPEPQAPASALLDELTAREREVVTLVARGLSNCQIAEQLVVSAATAKTHVSRAMIKLHARSRAQLVVFAYESRLVLPRAPHDALPHQSASAAEARRVPARHQSPQTRVAPGPELVAPPMRGRAMSETVVA